jgi:xylan 1,4-beta-xylosidase
VRKGPDINALAARNDKSATVMVWNYHDDDKIFPAAPITLKVNGIQAKEISVTHFRIDKEHSNSYELWKKMGSPQNPTPAQIEQMEKGGKLEALGKPEKLKVKSNSVTIPVNLPSQGVELLKIDW